MRPGFLAGVDYWFGETPTYRPEVYDLYKDQTKLNWFDQFWASTPTWKKYIR